MIHGLELPIQAQDLVKAYQTSTYFWDIYHYITDGKLPSDTKAQNCIHAEALNYVVVNNFLFRIDTQKDKGWDKGNLFLLVILHDPSSRNCAVFMSYTYIIFTANLNSKELHLQGVAPRSQHSDPTPEVVSLQ